MADLENLGILKSLMEMDSAGLELMNHFQELNASAMGNQYLGLMDHSNWPHQFDYEPCLSNYVDNHPILLQGGTLSPPPPPPPVANSMVENGSESKRRKVAAVTPSHISGSGTGLISDHEAKSKRKNKSEKGMKGKSKVKGEEKPREVVHVRARRGHATDSHSLAERVRREKINERMRCLQDLVPGCYKAMGMAVMLDEIIKYVRSLQNQVEFLSMKISDASAFYDFSLDMDAVQITQFHQRVNGNESVDVDRLIREGYGGGCTSFHPTLPF